MKTLIKPTGQERTFRRDEIIVSKTDKRGHITYSNQVFRRIARYDNSELQNKPHNIIRHPDMPGGVFLYMWNTLFAGEEVYAYVNNLASDGANYWVLAHITPTYGLDGEMTGFHSNRRSPSRTAIAEIEPVYKELRTVERKISNRRQAAQTSLDLLGEKLSSLGLTYPEFVWDVIARNEL